MAYDFYASDEGVAAYLTTTFSLFKNKIARTLSVVYSQSEPYFSDGITAPYVEAYEEIEFPKIMYVYDDGNELIMTLDEKTSD